MAGRILAKTGLALALLLLALPSHAVDVQGTSARLGWTAASGPVASYGVFLSKNGAAYPATPNQVVTTNEFTLNGAVGETYLVKVAAYDAAGTKGPDSAVSTPVVFVAAPPPPTPASLSVPTTTLNVSVIQGQNAAAQSFTVRNAGGGTLGYQLAYSHDWIVLGTSAGTATTETDTIPVSFATSALPAGTYAGFVTVVQSSPATTPPTEVKVAVNLSVTAQAPPPVPASIVLSATSLTATAQKGQSPANQTLSIRNGGGGTLAYTVSDNVSWLAVSPASGTSTGENDALAVSFSTTGLNAGTYNANVTVAATGLPSVVVPVTLTITEPPPALALSTSALTLSVAQGQNAAAQSFTIRNAGGGTLSYAVSDNASWLAVSPASGTSTGESDSIGLSFTTSSLAAGSHTALVTVSATGLPSQTVTVNLTVNAAQPAISVPTTSLSVSVEQGKNPAAQSITVQNAGGGTLGYLLAYSHDWIVLGATSGSTTGTSTVPVNFATAALPAGSYTGVITVVQSSPATTPQTERYIFVNLTVTAPKAVLSLSTTALTASTAQGTDAAAQSFTVRNSGGGTLSYTISDDASWLAVTPASGTSTGESDVIGVSFTTAGLAKGSHTATVTVAATGLPAQTVTVSLTVTDAPAALSLSTTALTASAAQGTDAAAQSFTVRNSGGGTLSYTVSDDASWLAVTPASGTSTGESDVIGVSFTTAGLAKGSHTATVTVAATGLPAQMVTVSLTVTDAPASISLDSPGFSLVVTEGQSPPGSTFRIRNAGGGTLSYTLSPDASWLRVTPASGTSAGESDTISVAYDTASLAPGNHMAMLAVNGQPGVPSKVMFVNLVVNAAPAQVALSTNALDAAAEKGEVAAAASFAVRNAGGGTLAYSIAADVPWLAVAPASGTSTGESDLVGVTYATAGLAPGSYSGTVTVSGGAGVAAQSLVVTLTVSDLPPRLEVSAPSLSASAQKGQSPAAQSFTVRNAGGGSLAYDLAESASWLAVTPASGTSTGESDVVNVTFSTAGLAPGNHTTSIRVSGNGVSPVDVPVTVTVSDLAPEITLSTTALSASVQRGQGAAPASFTVRNSGGGTLSYAVAAGTGWLSVSPPAGTSTGESDVIGLSYDTLALPVGTHNAVVTVSGSGVTPKTVTVSVTVVAGPPVLEVSTATLEVAGTPGQSVPSQGFTIRNAGDGTLTYGVVSDKSWLSVNPPSGTSTGESDALQVSFSSATLPAGTHQASLTVTASGLPSKTIAVTLRLTASSARFDLDGDGLSDAMFRHAGGALTAWLVNGTSVRQSLSPVSMYAFWKLVGAGDFDGDGRSFDLLWVNPNNGGVMIALNDGATQKGLGSTGVVNPAWRVGAVADFDGDGRSDVLWIDPATGSVTIWLVNRYSVRDSRVAGTLGPDWKVAGAGDFDGDRKADVLFERAASYERILWLMDGLAVRSSFAPASPPGFPWTTVATGDYDGDGRMDVVASYLGISYGLLTSTGTGFAATPFLGIFTSPTARVAGSGDRDGDGREDLLWFDESTGDASVLLVDPAQFRMATTLGSLPGGWKAVGAAGIE